jgi:hypothetical protein
MPTAPLVTTEHGVFLTIDTDGVIPPEAPGTLGLFYRDTRFLSGLDVRLDGERPPALSVDDHGWRSTITYDAQVFSKRGTAFPARLLLRRERYIGAPRGASPPCASA